MRRVCAMRVMAYRSEAYRGRVRACVRGACSPRGVYVSASASAAAYYSCLRDHTRQAEERLQIEDDLHAQDVCPRFRELLSRVWLQRTHGVASAGAHFHPPGLASSPTGSSVVCDEYL
jgi:hypothetical protein